MLSLAAASLLAAAPITVTTYAVPGYDESAILGGARGMQVGLVYKAEKETALPAVWFGDLTRPTILPTGSWGNVQLYVADRGRVAGRACLNTDQVYPQPWRAIVWDSLAQPPRDISFAGFYSSEIRAMSGDELGGFATPTQDGPKHPILWRLSPRETATIDLLPANKESGSILAVLGGKQAGAVHATKGAIGHAATWAGTPASFKDVNPPGYQGSGICAMTPTEMVGSGVRQGVDISQNQSAHSHALLWKGNKVIDLHPEKVQRSTATATDGSIQIGVFAMTGEPTEERACLWKGTAKSFVNLHALLPTGYDSSRATAIDGKIISGYAKRKGSDFAEAVVWTLP